MQNILSLQKVLLERVDGTLGVRIGILSDPGKLEKRSD